MDTEQQPKGTNEDFKVIGKRHRKVDCMDRLTGVARYTDDIVLPQMLHAKILRSPHAHAKILTIDTSRAEALDGVYEVVLGDEMPTSYGVIPWTPDEQALATDKVRYVGDALAAVVARDEETANVARDLIEVEYEILKPLCTPTEALANPNLKIHERNKRGNISKYVNLAFGEIDEKLEEASLVIEDHYEFHGTTHTPIEPHCAIGYYDNKHILTVWSATQVPHYLHRELSKVLGLPARQIRVIQPPLGGAFGGKSEPFDLEFVVAKLAMKTGRPVKCLYTREEVFLAHRGRHPFSMDYKTGFDKDGRILAVDAKTILDGGDYSSFGLVTTYYSGQLLCSPYRFDSYRFDSTRVYTNKPACGPKRGHGSVQPRFAIEVQLDKGAHALGIDPIELRRRNFIGENTRTINEFNIGSNGFLECLEGVEKASDWKNRYGKLPEGRGLGVAGSTYISGTNYCIYPTDLPQSGVQICLDRSGRVRIFAGCSDIGQGSDTMLAVVAAENLGVELDDVRVISADTDLCPVDLGAYSSRITLMAGQACLMAAQDLAKKIRQAVADHWECSPKVVALAQRQAFRLDQTETFMSIVEAFTLAEVKFGTMGSVGQYDTPKNNVHGEYRGGTIGASPAYSFTAHVAEVEVDTETGEVEIIQIWAAHDCGKALSPVLVEAQIEGSVYMGAAEAVMEHHYVMDSGITAEGKQTPGPGVDGLLAHTSLLDYRIPTSMDTPDIHSLIVEKPDLRGPYGAKEAGEGPLHPVLPAIANAVFDAIGVRIDELPITPEKILAAIEARDDANITEPQNA
ncbi:MAG: xanthine dehydrogenase family protein molybdopterin-binding subunit [Myxococcota bacterium]|nr:xanthine dehydrogenase family protein molybdopterin-binding subunit [Myxococcota bacterium]